MVVAQGGDLEDLHRPVKVDQVLEVTADQDGVIAATCHGVWFVCYAPRRWPCCQIGSPDYETGIVFYKKWESTSKRGNELPVFS